MSALSSFSLFLFSLFVISTYGVSITNNKRGVQVLVGCRHPRNKNSGRSGATHMTCAALTRIAKSIAKGESDCNRKTFRNLEINSPYRCYYEDTDEFLNCRKRRFLDHIREKRQRVTVNNEGNCGDDIPSIYLEMIVGEFRVIASNGIPDHNYDDNTPGKNCEQYHVQVIPSNPDAAPLAASKWTPNMGAIGISRSGGLLFNHMSAEVTCRSAYYSEFRSFGTCSNDATGHGANGEFHYHGPSICLTNSAKEIQNEDCPIIGYVVDGFPVRSGAGCSKIQPCYSLISDTVYSCTVTSCDTGRSVEVVKGCDVDDYEFVQDSACNLDDCNGKSVDEAYGYYLTDTYPYIMPKLKGDPDNGYLCYVDTT